MWELIVSYILNSSKERKNEENRLRYEKNRLKENFHNKIEKNSSAILQKAEEITQLLLINILCPFMK